MSTNDFSYYKFRKDLDYQIYLRFEDFDFESKLVETLELMGFEKIERDEVKKIAFYKDNTRVLKVTKAAARIHRKMDGQGLLKINEQECFQAMGLYDIYMYKNVAMMVLGEHNPLWELGIKATEDSFALRVVFTRFLSMALASQGVIGFWGTPVDQGFVMMNQSESNSESVFIDIEKGHYMTFEGVNTIPVDLQILRLSPTLKDEALKMPKESLYSFLSIKSVLPLRRNKPEKYLQSLYELTQVATGFDYPEMNFKSRLQVSYSN